MTIPEEKISSLLFELLQYLEVNRGSGHTTALVEGARHAKNPLILASHSQLAQHLANQANSPYNKENPPKFCGFTNFGSARVGTIGPLLIDNSALIAIFRSSLYRIQDLESELAKARSSELSEKPKRRLFPLFLN